MVLCQLKHNKLLWGAEGGASLIEFALVLPLLLVLLVGVICFGYVYVLHIGATHAAQQGAIAAVGVSPVHADKYSQRVQKVVADVVHQSLDWLPASLEDAVKVTAAMNDSLLKVQVTIPVAGGSSPLLPRIHLPPFGQVPPENLDQVTGVAKIDL